VAGGIAVFLVWPTQATSVAEQSGQRPRRAPASQAAAQPSADLIEPEGGSGQAGLTPARASRSAPSAVRASRVPRTARATAPNRATGSSYAFPGRADELESGEYWYWKAPDGHGNGSQKYAYDLTSAKYYETTNAWSECKADASGKPLCTFCGNASRNEDCLVYGEPLFAMAPGVVERCWRNAPENPRPGTPHAGRTSTPPRIGGGGNSLLVRHDDGSYALYAHMKPGTIPASLCPHTGSLMADASDPSEAAVPAGQRARIARGQFVGRVGNSGKSSNPHVHVHVQDGPEKSADGVALNFSGGFLTEADDQYEGAWVRLDGRTRPVATSAIWPDFSAGRAEIAYHGLSAALYQKLFEHASASGYRLDWIDGFVLKGRTYFNVLFRPRGNVQWAASHNLTGGEYQQMADRRKKEGMRIWHVDSYVVGNTVYYAAVFVKDGKGSAAYHGATQAVHQKNFDEWTKDGWRPRSISVTSVDGQRYYTATYERGKGPFLSRSALTPQEYQALTQEQYDSGRQIGYLNAYTHNGQLFFSAVYVPASGSKRALHGLSGADYQREWERARRDALLTRAVTGYVDGSTVRYAAAWAR
jgi:hypothetical protein